MSRDKRDLLNGESSLEEPTCCFMTKVMKMKIFDLQLSALPTKGRADRPSIVRKYAPAAAPG
jgi:hypothetical protein